MSEVMTCYERDDILCEDGMCLRTGCRLRNKRLDAERQGWQPIETASRDGRELLMTDGAIIRVCYPKRFPRSLAA